MKPVEVYQAYNAIRLHFTTDSYDYFKYNGKTKAFATNFNTRPDKIFFEKLAKHPDPIGKIVSNMVVNPKLHIRSLAYDQACEDVWVKWSNRKQSLSYHIEQQLKQFDDLVEAFKGTRHYPDIVDSFLADNLSLETFSVMVDLTNADKLWLRNFPFDPVIEDISNKARKYIPWLEYDKKKIRNITKRLTEHA